MLEMLYSIFWEAIEIPLYVLEHGLARKHLLVAAIVANRGDDRAIHRQRYRRKDAPFEPKASHQLRGQALRIGGAPVVATDCQNGPREILDGGRYGRLVPVGDVPALAEAILAALTDPRSPVPEEAWIHHSQDAAVEYYLGILQVVGHE